MHEESVESKGLKFEHEFKETKGNATLTFSTRLPNGALFHVIQTVFKKETKLHFPEEGVTLDMDRESIKYSFRIEEWPFKNNKNRLEICTVQTSSAKVKCSKKKDEQVCFRFRFVKIEISKFIFPKNKTGREGVDD